MLKNCFAVLIFAVFTGCATTDSVNVNDSYLQAIDAYSDGDVQYYGAYANFKYRATIENSAIQQTTVDKKAEIYMWDAVKKQQELTLMQSDNNSKTKVFLSFFTPNRMDDNLATKKSVWAVYLETSQGRYEGAVIKNRISPTELSVLYPYHNRFATAYEVTFPVGVASIENEETTMTITGPLGTKKVKFPAKK
jgi:hypothetical protein